MDVKRFGLYLGPAAGLFFFVFTPLDPVDPDISYTAGIALWMAVWWMLEAIPLAATSLLPIVLFPFLGVMNGKAVSGYYINHIVFLFIGGFLVALAMERWDLHRRIALNILMFFGVEPKRILLGFMVATAFLSMWISNTATAMMMVPIALAIIVNLESLATAEQVRPFSLAIFLGIAYSATIGGIATLVGTPPNLVLARLIQIIFPAIHEINFVTWMIFAMPISILFLALTWFILQARYCTGQDNLRIETDTFQRQIRELGPMTYEQRIILVDFVLLALLWISRADITLGSVTIPGWSRLFPQPSYINDGTVAIFMALILFIIPARTHPRIRLLDWETAKHIPWNIVLLFGGGFALAGGFKTSGLATWLGHQFVGLNHFPLLAILVLLALFVTFLTELTSNTATAQILIPIVASLAVDLAINPLFLLIPATLSCSFAFMLPVATPPNAIVFGTNRMTIREMIRVGIWLNLIGAIIIVTAIFLLGGTVFHIDLNHFPDWAILQ